jgi:hypothetical protein
MNPNSEFEQALAAAADAMERAQRAPAQSREAEDGPGAAIANARLLQQLRTQVESALLSEPNARQIAIQAIRSGLKQVDAAGNAVHGQRIVRPDKAYMDTHDRRVNIEIDTDPRSAMRHARRVNRDLAAMNYYLIADPDTGDLIGGRVREPNAQERVMTREEVQRVQDGIGLPQPAANKGRGPQRRRRTMDPALADRYGIQIPARGQPAPRQNRAARRSRLRESARRNGHMPRAAGA